MKKTYNRPEIVFENFNISSSIAACAKEADSTRDSCGYAYIAGRTLFVEENTGCSVVALDGSNGICFYIPTADTSLFAS